ncbi:hypothetical protein HPB49_026072 [Dermacentor silvarum]|nr:hypothetical protein HPB49_026072 [Dermacentor silvarum]
MADYNPTKNTKRNRSAVLKWHSYPESNVLNFKREHAWLFHPFRKEIYILDCNKFNDIFDTNCQAIMEVKKTFTHNVDINDLVTMCDRIISEDREMRAQVEARQEEQMRQLQQESETIVRMVNCVDDSDIRLGCGKRFDLKLVVDIYNRYYKGRSDDRSYNAYIPCATTGKAADALGGIIIHSAFKLVVQSTNLDKRLSSSDLNTFRAAFKNIKCIIIDEVSISLVMIDSRLRNISMRLDEPFGDYDIILCRDLRQLPPVQAPVVYSRSRLSYAFFTTQPSP